MASKSDPKNQLDDIDTFLLFFLSKLDIKP